MGWLVMRASISRAWASEGVYMERVSSSVGGLSRSLAAWMAGMAAIVKPIPEETRAIAKTLRVRRRRERLSGGAMAAILGKLVFCTCEDVEFTFSSESLGGGREVLRANGERKRGVFTYFCKGRIEAAHAGTRPEEPSCHG